jgi:CheY-like chemotaxis protein
LNEILIVDDNDFNSFTLKQLIEMNFGLQSDTACHGLEAKELVEQRKYYPYKLILMDLMMPVMDGYEATLHIREIYDRYKHHRELYRIVALSAISHKFDE